MVLEALLMVLEALFFEVLLVGSMFLMGSWHCNRCCIGLHLVCVHLCLILMLCLDIPCCCG